MKKNLFLFFGFIMLGCGGDRIPEAPKTTIRPSTPTYMDVSFEFGSEFSGDASSKVAVFYTDDNDSLYLNKEWVRAIRAKMKNMSGSYPTVLLFDSKTHTPDVSKSGMKFPDRYDKYMVCGYWKFAEGKTKFCYGGTRKDGSNNFEVCE